MPLLYHSPRTLYQPIVSHTYNQLISICLINWSSNLSFHMSSSTAVSNGHCCSYYRIHIFEPLQLVFVIMILFECHSVCMTLPMLCPWSLYQLQLYIPSSLLALHTCLWLQMFMNVWICSIANRILGRYISSYISSYRTYHVSYYNNAYDCTLLFNINIKVWFYANCH